MTLAILNSYSSIRTSFSRMGSKMKMMLLIIVSLFAILFMFIVYLAMINSSVISGYKISKLERELSRQQEVYKKLELEAVKLQAYPRIQEKIAKLNLVKIDNVSYVKEKFSLALKE